MASRDPPDSPVTPSNTIPLVHSVVVPCAQSMWNRYPPMSALRRSVYQGAPDSERQTLYEILRRRGSLVRVVHQQVVLGFEEVSIWLEARSQLVDRLPLRHQPG